MYMVMFVLDVADRLDAVLDAWDAMGVCGATIAETTGVHRQRARRRHVPTPYAIGGMGPIGQEYNYTLWVIVPDEETARRCLVAAEGIVGDLDAPNTGVLAAWPLTFVKGVPHQTAGDRQEGRWSG